MRNFAFGTVYAGSRVGGLVSGFLVQTGADGWSKTPEAIFVGLAFVAAALAFLLPAGAKGARGASGGACVCAALPARWPTAMRGRGRARHCCCSLARPHPKHSRSAPAA